MPATVMAISELLKTKDNLNPRFEPPSGQNNHPPPPDDSGIVLRTENNFDVCVCGGPNDQHYPLPSDLLS